jgi:hypothetical protein
MNPFLLNETAIIGLGFAVIIGVPVMGATLIAFIAVACLARGNKRIVTLLLLALFAFLEVRMFLHEAGPALGYYNQF